MAVMKGSLVKFHYTGRFDNGEVFSSSIGKEPAECKVGEGRLIKGIEEELMGMEESEKKEIVVPPDKGYGQRDENLVKKVSRHILRGQEIEIGQIVKLKDQRGNAWSAEVLAMDKESITLDLNHPLAGKTLKFDIEVAEID